MNSQLVALVALTLVTAACTESYGNHGPDASTGPASEELDLAPPQRVAQLEEELLVDAANRLAVIVESADARAAVTDLWRLARRAERLRERRAALGAQAPEATPTRASRRLLTELERVDGIEDTQVHLGASLDVLRMHCPAEDSLMTEE